MTITPNSINLVLDGRMRTISKTHLNHDAVVKVVQAYQKSALTATSYRDDLLNELRDLVDIPTFITRITEGRVRIGDQGVMFDNDPVVGVIADRLMTMLQQGFDPRPLARFLQRLKTNPLSTAIDEMYLWLESGNLPITEDGCFLAFKLVEDDFASGHWNPDGSKLYNHVGTVVQMPREEVDPNRNATCSKGLHFCSWQYLPNFGLSRDNVRVVVLKIAPEDVVSIPYDYNNSKGRAWRYLVLSEVPKDECEHLFANRPVVDSFGCYDGTDDGDDQDPYYDDSDDYLDDSMTPSECCDTECVDRCQAVDGDCPMIGSDTACGDGIDGTADHDDDDDEGDERTFKYVPTGKVRAKTLTATELRQMIADYGQRGTAKMTGIPRTTLQGWLKQID